MEDLSADQEIRYLEEQVLWKRIFASLRYPNYRLWFLGQMVSLFGTWMQMTAISYFVFELTHSPAFLGFVGFASGVPAWIFMLYAGVIADRIPRRGLLLITQIVMMLLAFILAGMTFANIIQPWHIIVLAFALGVTNAFDAPARLAFVVELVERKDLTNAIVLNTTMFNLAMAIGPAISGVAYAFFGPGWCFAINGISFIAVIIALLLMKLGKEPIAKQRKSVVSDLKEGLHYLKSRRLVQMLMGLIAMVTLFGISFVVLIPAWAVTILGGDAATNGWLLCARGAGAFTCSVLLASLGRFKFKGRLLSIGIIIFPIVLLCFAIVRSIFLSISFLFFGGATVMLAIILCNTLLQELVPDHLRGRVMSIYSLIFFGFMPIGALWIGSAAEIIGAPGTIALGSVFSLVFSILIWILVPKLRTLK